MKTKRFLSLLLAVCTILSVLAGLSFTASAATVEYVETGANTELAEVSKDYGLAKNIQDGNILHCFNWKYNDIKAELANIAAAGFTSVQTSPAQPAGTGEWYWLYQPYGFYIGTNALGSKSDLQSLCAEADKYGIKVVVDVVANHLNGDTGRVQDDLRDGQYWHNYGTVSNWVDRYQVTQGEIGMRDLNSEHSYVQQKVASYMKELEGIGVDGIRWDAAKHIALPSENCNFWKAVTSNNSMWHYGEILVGPSDGGGTEGLMKEYTDYMSVTDSVYGGDVRNAFAGGNAPGSNGNWVNRGIAPNKLVLWGESHDTYSNGAGEWGASTNMSQNVIDRAYAVVASRNGSNALYFSRPSATDKGSIHSGQKGSTSFKSAEITAVNQLKNACANEKDYYQSTNGCAVVNRESGAVIVLGGGGNRDVSVANGGGTTRPGTYKDLVTGSTWTVTSSQMSGKVGQNGIAVLLNAKPAGPSASVSPDSKNYTTDTLELTLSFDNATSGQYSINGGAFQSFTNGQKITIGKGTAAGTQTTISVKAINGSTTSDVETYEYNHAELADTGIYCDSTGTDWSNVNCYIYKNGQGYKEWPGEAMTSVGDNLWYYEVPAGYENCQVIFSQGGNNQYPAEDGLNYSGGAMIFSDGQWQQHTVVKPNTTPAPLPTQAPQPTETQATRPTQAPKPTQAPVKTDPTEDNTGIIVIPPAPIVNPTNPSNTPTIPGTTGGEKYKYGDIDLNGKITIKDVTTIQKALAKLSSLSTIQMIVSDVNGDGKINVKDVSTIQKYCATIISSFTSGEWYTVPGGPAVEPTEATTEKPVETDPTEAPAKPTEAPTKPTEVPTQPTV
ncbi:MAG: starch-binding protein, partial [Ruminococcus sp.]|nr:starch-binding protein [Ruminococcus sp.]